MPAKNIEKMKKITKQNNKLGQNSKYIKVGDIYWIKPKALHNMPTKLRPAIAIKKFGVNSTLFLQIGSTKYEEASSKQATTILRRNLPADHPINDSYIHIDVSKVERNDCVEKPHIHKGEYLTIDFKDVVLLKNIWLQRIDEVEKYWWKKAKGAVFANDITECVKYLKLIKNSNPHKHKNLKIQEWIKEQRKKLEDF